MATVPEEILRLAEALPEVKILGADARVEDQARAVLHFVVDPIVSAAFDPLALVEPDASLCPNCDKPSSSTKTPYCGTTCRNVAGFVRQFRGALADGSLMEPERQEAIGQVFWYLAGGGRPLRQELVLERTRTAIFKKGNGLCAVCGAPATCIDHILSGCNRPINLQATCEACCKTKPFGDTRVTDHQLFVEIVREFVVRIGSLEPVRCCDDPVNWDWRAYVKQRA